MGILVLIISLITSVGILPLRHPTFQVPCGPIQSPTFMSMFKLWEQLTLSAIGLFPHHQSSHREVSLPSPINHLIFFSRYFFDRKIPLHMWDAPFYQHGYVCALSIFKFFDNQSYKIWKVDRETEEIRVIEICTSPT